MSAITNENILDAINNTAGETDYIKSARIKGDYVEVKCQYGGIILVQMDQEYGYAEYRTDGKFRREGSACEELCSIMKEIGLRAYVNNRI